MILEALTVGPFAENCYIIGDPATGEGAMVDPGDEAARTALAVEGTNLEIAQIIVTHAHIDHVGAVAALVDEYACPVVMHAEAEQMLQQLPTQAMMMGLRFGKVPGVDRHVEDGEILEVGDLQSVLAMVGVTVAIVAVALISGVGGRADRPTSRLTVALAVLAGTGFGLLFVFLDRTSDDSGFWPLLIGQLTTLPLVAAAVLVTRTDVRSVGRAGRLAAGAGTLAVVANVSYLLATREGLLSLVAVITSMYPASTVVLATSSTTNA